MDNFQAAQCLFLVQGMRLELSALQQLPIPLGSGVTCSQAGSATTAYMSNHVARRHALQMTRSGTSYVSVKYRSVTASS